jgi:pimeloyl-ACP methyl ester carboxylesterase
VLVHGAWADGSSWSEVIPILQAAGLHVTAVQNPLSSLADSVDATKRALAEQDGPTVLAAHSWGGTVISQVGTDPKVTGLVYVAARAPDANEDFVALSKQFPTGPARAGVVERDGYTKLSEDAFLKYFANGVKPNQAKELYAVQWPTAASIHGGGVALQAELVRGVEERLHYQPRLRALPRQAHERHHDRARRRSPVPGVASEGYCELDPGSGGVPAELSRDCLMKGA